MGRKTYKQKDPESGIEYNVVHETGHIEWYEPGEEPEELKHLFVLAFDPERQDEYRAELEKMFDEEFERDAKEILRRLKELRAKEGENIG